MCCDDVKIARGTTAIMQSVAVPVTSEPIAGDAPDRFALQIGPPIGNNVFLAMGTAATAAGGILLRTTDRPLCYDLKTHGAMVTMNWTAIGSGGAAVLPVIEVMSNGQCK